MKKLILSLLLAASMLPAKAQNNPESSGNNPKWWKEAVIYQLYPRSFKDSDGDGIGDLKGIISKLDYLKNLGIDAIWFNPIFTSPNDDNGYDVSDYRGIMKEFGTMEDFDLLLKEMKKRNIRMVLDLVVNHSSDEHKWFQESRKSRNNPYRDYYHWWPAEKGKPAYRWSHFDVNSDAWAYDSLTNAYYLHYFSRKQPDLKWENPKVRQEVYEIMKFWLEKGIDGFRIDAFQYASKDTTFPDFPKGYQKDVIKYYGMQNGLHGYLQEMYKEVLSKYDAMTVAEGAGTTFEDAHGLSDKHRNEMSMVYHFDAVRHGSPNGYDLTALKRVFTRWDSAFSVQGWQSIFLANHDQPRMTSKYGNDKPAFRALSTKLLNTFVLSMRGTPYLYLGDEIGMTNIYMDKIEDYKDIDAINGYIYHKNNGLDLNEYMERMRLYSRDNSRTPFQWDAGKNAGFTTGSPWLKINPNYPEINVAKQEKDTNSVLNYTRKMIHFRKNNKILVYGDYQIIDINNPNIFAFTRSFEGKKMLILLNFSENLIDFRTSLDNIHATYQLGNYAEKPEMIQNNNVFNLRPLEAVIYELK